jgi:ubiquitin carboxyl-terminal hydrolase 5/13
MDIDNATPKTDNNPKATNPLAHDSPVPIFQEGVRPTGFKALVGKGHAEFATMKQQDAEEFFSFLLEALRRDAHRLGQATVTKGQAEAALKATDVFKFGMESRLECSGCRGVRYRTEGADVLSIAVPAREKSKDADEKTIWHEVELEECLQALFGAEELEYRCPKCERDVGARK